MMGDASVCFIADGVHLETYAAMKLFVDTGGTAGLQFASEG